MKYNDCSFIYVNSNLSSTAKLVYCVMQNYKKEDSVCYLTAQQIADLVGCHRNSVTRAIASLEYYFAVKAKLTQSIKNRPQYVYKVNDELEANDWLAQREMESQVDNYLEKSCAEEV